MNVKRKHQGIIAEDIPQFLPLSKKKKKMHVKNSQRSAAFMFNGYLMSDWNISQGLNYHNDCQNSYFRERERGGGGMFGVSGNALKSN